MRSITSGVWFYLLIGIALSVTDSGLQALTNPLHNPYSALRLFADLPDHRLEIEKLFAGDSSSVPATRFGWYSENAAGAWRLPFEPASIRQHLFYTGGHQRLSQRQTIAGLFIVRNQHCGDKQWVHNRSPYSGVPYLLADSTTGGFDLTGFLWEINHSWRFNPRFALSTTLFYNVDEQMKTVFPKPQIKHRDIAGHGRLIAEDHRIGKAVWSIGYFDFQEILITTPYSLDQDQSVRFILIRGLDLPIPSSGETSKERLQAQQAVFTGLGWSSPSQRLFESNLQLIWEQGGTQLQDGTLTMLSQGKLRSRRLCYQAGIGWNIDHRNRLTLDSDGQLYEQIGKLPHLTITAYRHRIRFLGGRLAWRLHSEDRLYLTVLIEYGSQTLLRTDLEKGILDYFPADYSGCGLQYEFSWPGGHQLTLSARMRSLINRPGAVFTERAEMYYHTVTLQEEKWYQSDKMHWQLTARLLTAPRYGYCYGIEIQADRWFNQRQSFQRSDLLTCDLFVTKSN